jgi:hypothetical protein
MGQRPGIHDELQVTTAQQVVWLAALAPYCEDRTQVIVL